MEFNRCRFFEGDSPINVKNNGLLNCLPPAVNDHTQKRGFLIVLKVRPKEKWLQYTSIVLCRVQPSYAILPTSAL